MRVLKHQDRKVQKMKKNKIKIATSYGCYLYPFKGATTKQAFNVPKGGIYGIYEGVYFAVTKLPDDREHAHRVFVWTYNERKKIWYERTMHFYFDEEVVACKGDMTQATINTRIASAVLGVLVKYPELRIEGFYPPCCRHYSHSMLPKDRNPNNWTFGKGRDLWNQSCVDGKGYKPHEGGEYDGAMTESFPQLYPTQWEHNYWARA